MYAVLLINDFIIICRGQKEVCVMFCIIHLVTAIWKRISVHPSLFVASIGLSVATSIFSFSFETWMVLQHEKVC